jgi:hypothetical protein
MKLADFDPEPLHRTVKNLPQFLCYFARFIAEKTILHLGKGKCRPIGFPRTYGNGISAKV